MTTDTGHTYGFYLILLNRIRRDIGTNRTAYRQTSQTHDTNTALLQLMDKYASNKKSTDNVNKIITHSQAASRRLDSEFRLLQSDFDSLNAYIQNNDDIAGRAYDAAYSTTQKTHAQPEHVSFLLNIARFFAQHTK